MTLQASFDRIKAACDFQSLTPEACAVTFKDGWAYARNRTLMAKIPFPGVPDCVVPAKELRDALRIFSDVTKARLTEKSLILDSGQSRAMIPRIPFVIDYALTEVEMVPVPVTLISAVVAVSPFCSDDRTRPWQMGARLDGRRLTATNNIALVEADLGTDTGHRSLTLSDALVRFLASPGNNRGLTAWGVTSEEIRFAYSDGGWVRASRLNPEMPDRVVELLDRVFVEALDSDFEVDRDWRDEVVRTLSLADDLVTFDTDKITGRRDGMELACDRGTPNLDEPRIYGKEIFPILLAATHIDFSSNPTTFSGKGLRGVVAPRSTN